MGALPEEDEKEEEEEEEDERKGEEAGSGTRVSPPLPLELGLERQHAGGTVERRRGAATETSSVSFGADDAAAKAVVGRGEGAARMEEGEEELGRRGVG